MNGDQNFWARRRAAVAAESQAEQAALEAQSRAREHAILEEKTDAELLADLDLPDPDTLKMGDDFSAFMSKAVPDRLRRRALRVLWRSNPLLANVDMLVDYGEDFTDSVTVMENMQTAYQVGKGMLKHVDEMTRQAEEQKNPPLDEAFEEEVEEDILLAAVDDGEAPYAETIDIAPQDNEPYQPPAPRRMRFTVEGTAA